MIHIIFEYEFIQYAILASILASIVCGIIGVIIVEKNLVMMSGGIAHTSYGGVGLGYLLGFEPIIGAFLFSIASSIGITFIKRRGGAKSDVLIGLFWSLGMSLGIFFIALMPGYPPNLSSYLFGNILSVTKLDLYLIISLTIIIVITIFIFFDYWKAYLFDDEFAYIMGIKTAFLEYLLLILVSMTVVVLIRVVGIVLVIALLTAPAACSSIFSNNFKVRIWLAILFGNVFCLGGLYISYNINIASGAIIVILAVMAYLILYIYDRIRKTPK